MRAAVVALPAPVLREGAPTEAPAPEGVRHLLDLDFATVPVPKAGRTAPGVSIPRIVIDPSGQEVAWVTRALTASVFEGLAPATAKAYAKSFLRGARFLWAMNIEPATLSLTEYTVLRGWLRWQRRLTTPRKDDAARPLADSTLAQTEAALLCIYDYAITHGLIDGPNPVRLIRASSKREEGPDHNPRFDTGWNVAEPGKRKRRSITKVQERVIEPLQPEVAEALRNATRLRDRALWTLCLDGGPRANEALSLTLERYRPRINRADVVAKGRDGATRPIPVSDEAAEAIAEYLDELASAGWRPASEDQIFRTLYRPFRPLTYMGLWKALRRATGNEQVHPHALRHTAAMETLGLLADQQGRGLLIVQHMLGHAHLQTTEKYLHLTDNEAIRSVTQARRAPRRTVAPVLSEVYGDEHLALLAAIRAESTEQ